MIDIWMSCPSLYPVYKFLGHIWYLIQRCNITIYIASYSYWSPVITPSHWMIFAANTQISILHKKILIRNILEAWLWKLGMQGAGPLSSWFHSAHPFVFDLQTSDKAWKPKKSNFVFYPPSCVYLASQHACSLQQNKIPRELLDSVECV